MSNFIKLKAIHERTSLTVLVNLDNVLYIFEENGKTNIKFSTGETKEYKDSISEIEKEIKSQLS